MVKPQTILLVDDHSLITTAMSALLQSMYPDVQIHVGATAKEAVELAENYGDSADLRECLKFCVCPKFIT